MTNTEDRDQILELAEQVLDFTKEHSPRVISNQIVQMLKDRVLSYAEMYTRLAEVAGTPKRFTDNMLLANEMIRLAKDFDRFFIPEVDIGPRSAD